LVTKRCTAQFAMVFPESKQGEARHHNYYGDAMPF
jgi:hypothetical protein